jgi:hypothetical protein
MTLTKTKSVNRALLFTKRNPNTDQFKQLTLFKYQAQLLAHSLGTVVAFINPATMSRIARLHQSEYEQNEADEANPSLNYLKNIYNIFRLLGQKSLNKTNNGNQLNICNVSPAGAAVDDNFLYDALFNASKHTCVFISYGLPNARLPGVPELSSQLITGLCIISNASVQERNTKEQMFWKTIHNMGGVPLSDQELEQVNQYYGEGKLADLLVICAQPKTTPLSHTSKHTALPLLIQSLAKIAAMKQAKSPKYKGVIVEASRGKNKDGEVYIPAQQLLESCGFRHVKLKLHALLDEAADVEGADLNVDDYDMDNSIPKKVKIDTVTYIQDYFVLFDEHNGERWFEKIHIMDYDDATLCPFSKEGLWAKHPYCL